MCVCVCMESKALVKSTNSNVVYRFFAHTPSRILRMVNIGEVGTNPTSIRPTKRNRCSNKNSLQKHQSESTFTGWRHRIIRHCSRSTTRGHAGPIPLYHLSRLCAYNFDRQNQRKWLRADKEKKQMVPHKNNY